MSVGVEPDPGGIHTHQDGVIHIHPFQTATTGRNARLSDFFGQTGLDVTSNKIQLPDDPALGDNSGKTFENGDECPDGQEGVVKVLVWEDAAGTDDPKVFIADIDRIRFTNNAHGVRVRLRPGRPGREHHPPSADGSAARGAGRARLGRGGHVRRRDLDHRRPDRHHDRRHRHHHGATSTTAPAATATTLAGG